MTAGMVFCARCGEAASVSAAEQLAARTPCSACGLDLPIPGDDQSHDVFGCFCSGCGRAVLIPASDAGGMHTCSYCWTPIAALPARAATSPVPEATPPATAIEAPPPREAAQPAHAEGPDHDAERVCPVCQWKLGDVAGDRTRCPECDTAYHAECWEENRGCAVYGCPKVPPVEHYAAVEIPVSYWGQESKQCPSCQAEILAAAVRCRACGATFASATPLTPEEWSRQQRRRSEAPAYRARVLWLSVLCLMPWTAPLAGAFGYLWYRCRKPEIETMPALYPALCKIALGVAFAQTTLGALIVLLR